ncbi:SusC/RagA family TonB-linked outer membrane protein [Duncaniella freteri]|uniref:SusC/RagA family TonB-linked outer membrane protein n=1 Tax=Duncaniella freteri TaxID=2530391 RepID=UPI0025581450|nr:SusC/RagA family TonB-linked outer membrane protein [Duncaniella freteri]
MLHRITLLAIGLMLSVTMSSAQTHKVEGRVTDSEGSPVELATVLVKGTTISTYTDKDGLYTIMAAPKDHLIFSFISYEKATEKVGDRTVINVVLRETGEFMMRDIVVTGYGTQERRDLTGSVSSVKLKEDAGLKTVDQLLQGAAPGVYMTNSSGALGGANVLNIRGVSSIMGDNNPLYVIDGVPMYGTDRDANSVGTTGGSVAAASMGGTHTGGGSLNFNYDLKNSFEKNPLATLNPEDIESIEILKDAFATAIYGSRGAAGVVLITTKKGSRERTQINVGYTLSVDRPMGKPDLLNGEEYAMIYSHYLRNSNFPRLADTDWLDAVTRTAVSNSVTASISGGMGKSTYFLSTSYDLNQSYIINNDMDRFAARFNMSTEFDKRWTLGLNLSLNKLNNNALAASGIYSAALIKAPNLPIYNESGDYYYGYAPNTKGSNENYNPVAQAYINNESAEDTRVLANAYLEYKPLSWLSIRSEVGTDMYNSFSSVRKGELPENITGVPGNQAQETTNNRYKVVINNHVNASKILGNHFLQGVLGQSYEYNHERMNSVAGSNFFSPDLVGVGAAQTRRVIGAGSTKYALFSAFTRLNYQYDFKYMFGITYRVDGSSRYNRNNRYVHTPSVSAGWRLSQEEFIRRALPFTNDLKLRASLGLSRKDGNNSYYGAQAVYALNTLTTYGGNSFLTMSQPGNTDLGWEKTTTWDVGLDWSMLNERVKLTVDYYFKKTTNMLFQSNLPLYTGYQKQNQNIADMHNQGVEVQLVTSNIRNRDLQWQTIINLTHSNNKITKLNFNGSQLDDLNSSYKYYEVGQPAAQWYLHKWVGVDPLTGEPLWEYKDGNLSTTPPASDGELSQLNKFICGTSIPTIYGSVNNNLTYKGFELDFLFTFALGSKMMNSTRANLLSYALDDANNLSREMISFWQIPGQVTDIPKLNNASVINGFDYTTSITSTRFLENNSYLRLKTLTLAYNIPQKVLGNIRFMRQLRIYATATNLFTFTKYSGVDPEVSAFGSSALYSGYDNMTMPQSRSFQFGLRVGF